LLVINVYIYRKMLFIYNDDTRFEEEKRRNRSMALLDKTYILRIIYK